MIFVPSYLKEISEIEKKAKGSLFLKILCSCGYSEFFLLFNKASEAEGKASQTIEKRIASWKKMEVYTDPKTKTRYLVRRNFWGRIVDKINVEEIKAKESVRIFKVKCKKCGKEWILFDSRKYGYDAIMNDRQENNDDCPIQFSQLECFSCQIRIRIINDLSYDEFVEEKVNGTLEEFSNAYTSIEIFSVNRNKKKKVFEEETA